MNHPQFPTFRIFVGIAAMFFYPSLWGSTNVRFKRLSLEEGLAQTTVHTITQTRDGFIWFGTEEGLNRYDGYEFKLYKHEPDNPQSLSDSNVGALLEDRNGNFLIGTQSGGINIFDRQTGTFTRVNHDPERADSLASNKIISLYEARDGTLWVGTLDKGISYLIGGWQVDGENKFQTLQHDPNNPKSLSSDIIPVIEEDQQGRLWFGTGDAGVCRLESKPGEPARLVRLERGSDNSVILRDTLISALMCDSRGDMWIGAKNGDIYRWRAQTGEIEAFMYQPASSRTIQEFHEDSKGNLWVATMDQGTLRLIQEGPEINLFEAFVNNPNNPNSLSTNEVLCLFEDSGGVFWVGTLFGGVNKWDPSTAQFEHYYDDGSFPLLKGKIVTSLLVDNQDTLWVGTTKGLTAWKGGGLARNRANFQPEQVTQYRGEGPEGLISDLVFKVIQDRSGDLWVGTTNGLNRLPRGTQKFVEYRHDPDNPLTISSPEVRVIYEDRDDRLWVGTRKGICLTDHNRTSPEFLRIPPATREPGGLAGEFITSVLQDYRGAVWVGTALGGLNVWDGQSYPPAFKHFLAEKEHPDKLQTNQIFSIFEDRNNLLWIGTSSGLHRYLGEDRFESYQRSTEGSNVQYAILGDARGFLWISSNAGLSRFDPQTGEFRDFDTQDGLQEKEFNLNSAWSSSLGEMYFGGINGFNVFRPENITENPVVPQVVITSLLISYAEASMENGTIAHPIETLDNLVLSHSQDVFAFRFAGLHFANSEKNLYAYKLDGFDEDWIRTGSDQRLAAYTNLDSGKYVFKVKAANKDGVWTEEYARIAVEIMPSPWQTWWARLIYLLAALSLLAILYKMRVQRTLLAYQKAVNRDLDRQVAERTRELEEINQLKTRFFTNISHEFRTPLTLTMGPLQDIMDGRFGEVSAEVRQHTALMLRNSKRLLSLINQLLDVSKLDAGQMPLYAARGNIVVFVRQRVSLFADMAERKQLALTFKSDVQDIQLYYDQDLMEKALVNLLSNALKYTSQGKIEVSISQDPRSVTISVEDSGMGIPSDKLPYVFDRFYQVEGAGIKGVASSGLGLAFARELVLLHGGDIEVSSQERAGSCFSIRLLKGKAHLPAEALTNRGRQNLGAPEEEQNHVLLLEDGEPGPQAPLANQKADSGKLVVLIVEDDSEIREYIRDCLAPDYQILEAENGRTGFELASEETPNIIITDLMMPEVDGFELCRLLKASSKTSDIPIIILTARSGERQKVEGLELGADDYLVKPFHSRELLARIGNLIGVRLELKTRYSKEVILGPGKITISSADEVFIGKARDVMAENLSNSAFGVYELAAALGLSRRQLHRKLMSITGIGPADFIKQFRLERASDLITNKAGSISEIAYSVGFSSPSTFARSFKDVYGHSPRDFEKSQTSQTSPGNTVRDL